MNRKRITQMLKGVPSAKRLIEVITFPQSVNVYTDSDWAGQSMTHESTSGEVVRWRNETLSAWRRTQQSVSFSSADAELCPLTNGTAEWMVTRHLLDELGYEVTIVSHVDGQCSMAWASKRGLVRKHHVKLQNMFVQRCRGEEANYSCLCGHESEQSRLDDKVPYC